MPVDEVRRTLMTRSPSVPLVIYHAGCKDGFGSAWVLHNYFGEGNVTPNFHPGVYGEPPPNVEGRDVYILDFSYSREVMTDIIDKCQTLLLLDHHKTAAEALGGLDSDGIIIKDQAKRLFFDMNRSGIGMTWDFFRPDHVRPWIVDYVEDRDLWRWKLDDSRIVNAYTQSLGYDFHEWDQALAEGRHYALTIGKEFLRMREAYNKTAIEHFMQIKDLFGCAEVPVVNALTEGISELLEAMMDATGSFIAVGWRIRDDGTLSLSFRSKGDLDVSKIAKELGGGGHKNAAGAEVRGFDAKNFLGQVLA